MGSNEVEYIPQLDVYFDKQRNIYVDKHGAFINPEDERAPVDEDDKNKKADNMNVNNLKLSISTVVQVITFTIAVISQYNILKTGIDDSNTQLTLYKTSNESKFADFTEIKNEVKTLKAQVELQQEVINSLQVKLSNKR
jgi:hypothetical protein